MRDAFFAELLPLFKRDRRVVFLTGDLGYKLFDQLTEHDVLLSALALSTAHWTQLGARERRIARELERDGIPL